jgi:hypothetical protein
MDNRKEVKAMSKFSEWAKTLGVPTWTIWVAAVVAGLIVARLVGLY